MITELFYDYIASLVKEQGLFLVGSFWGFSRFWSPDKGFSCVQTENKINRVLHGVHIVIAFRNVFYSVL